MSDNKYIKQAVQEVIDVVGREDAWHVFENAMVEMRARNVFCCNDEDLKKNELYDELLYMRGLTKTFE